MTSCPVDEVDAQTWALLPMVKAEERGILPLAGGMLDQTAGYIDAAARVRYERDLNKD